MADSVMALLAKLKQESRKRNISFQQFLNLYCQEEFLRRLSKSTYRENLILKGGFLLYTISGFATRPTVDADYLLKNYSNDMRAIEKMVREIIGISSKEYIRFEILKMETINEIKQYNGIRIYMQGCIGTTRTPFSLDFGVGDVIVPNAIDRNLPTLLVNDESFSVITYSLESTIAEKLDAIANLMEFSGRMKDFYDIYYLSMTNSFNGEMVKNAIFETFQNRKRPVLEDLRRTFDHLKKSEDLNKRWMNFCLKIIKYDLDFKVVCDGIVEFLEQPNQSVVLKQSFRKIWDYKNCKWK